MLTFRNKYFILFFFIFIFCFCNRKEAIVYTVQLVPGNNIDLPLDSITQQFNPAICYVKNESADFLAIYNKYNKSIYFYDIEKKKNFKIISIPKGNGDGLDTTGVIGFFLNNADTIYLVTDDFQLHILNGKAQRIKSIDLSPFSANRVKLFKTRNISFPGFCYGVNLHRTNGNLLYLTGEMDDSWNNPDSKTSGILIVVNLSDGTKKYLSHYPGVYSKGRWSIYFNETFADYDPVQRSYVYSFPADFHLYTLDSDGNYTNKTECATSYSDLKIEPVSRRKYRMLPTRKLDEHYFKTTSYRYLMYDRFRDVFYRFVELPMNEYVPDNQDFKQYSIIILNHDLQIIGETLLPKGKIYLPGIMFICRTGLAILKRSKDENILRFTVFQLQKITDSLNAK